MAAKRLPKIFLARAVPRGGFSFMQGFFRAFFQALAAADALHGIGLCIWRKPHAARSPAQSAVIAGGIHLVPEGRNLVEKSQKHPKRTKVFAKRAINKERQYKDCRKTKQLQEQKTALPAFPVGQKDYRDQNHKQREEDIFYLS